LKHRPALSDLRVWRSDGELVDLAFEQETVETKPGRAMDRRVLKARWSRAAMSSPPMAAKAGLGARRCGAAFFGLEEPALLRRASPRA
jgi:hypothetical protein